MRLCVTLASLNPLFPHGSLTLLLQINTASYYVLGLPVGITVAFVGPKLGLNGLSSLP